jgi:hypothetical protein
MGLKVGLKYLTGQLYEGESFMRMHKKASALAVVGIVGMLSASSAWAITQSVTANIRFDTSLSMTKNADIDFKSVLAGVADTYTITTAGVVTAAGSGQVLSGAGTPVAGNITISGSTTQLINISVGSFVANGGVTLSNAKCAYNGGSSGSCTITGAAAPGAGKTLLLGVDAAVDGTQAAGATAAPTETVTVVYQ